MNDSQLSVGYLIVNAVTADGLIPVEDAMITVSITDEKDTTLYRVARTDRSGRTGKIPIITPNISLSLSPSDTRPYTSVVIEGEKEGFYSNEYVNVPIFPGVVTLQQVVFIPSDERAQIQDNNTIFYESEPSDL